MSRMGLPLVVVVLTVVLQGLAPLSRASESQVTTSGSAAESPPGAAVFEMKYRALNTPDDPMIYRSFWGFGTPGDGSTERDPFVKAVKSRVKECTPAFNRSLPKPQWSVVELDEKKEPVALYFDLNADGELSDNEKFPRAPKSNLGYPYVFVTSDFQVRTEDQREVPFRVMLVASAIGNGAYSFMWSPHCVLEGQALLAGVPTKLVLYAAGFSGSFTSFGQCSFSLLATTENRGESGGWAPRTTLSSLIHYQGAFYRLRVPDTHAPDSLLRVVLEKDTTPTGHADVSVAGQESLKTRLTSLRLQGAKDNTVHFSAAQAEPTLPAGQYKVSYGYLTYGRDTSDEWSTNFNDGPQLDITADQTTRLELGRPVLSVQAIEEKDRNTINAKVRSTYAKGTPIYLSPQIKGKAGEIYMRFSQKTAAGNSFTDVRPHVAILDANGKLVASGDMEYG